MKNLLNRGSIVVLLGTGGVGKTTIAAALGLAAAREGLDTALITVDPARRLRDALGLGRLSSEPARLDPKQLRAAGLDPGLKLSAMMLDVKGAWDALINRFVSDPRSRRRIARNRFYNSLTEQFAGSEAYAALERLYDLHLTGGFDLEIVDTPPAAQAFEFLQAPARMIRLLDSRAARWLLAPSLTAGQLAMRIAGRAARFVMGEIERFAGAGMLSAAAEFFAAASEAVDSIADRFRKTQALLHSPSTRFVMVTTAEEDRLREARELIAEMDREGLKPSAIVLNRVLDIETWRAIQRARPGYLSEVARLRAALGTGDPGLEALTRWLEAHRDRSAIALRRVARFARALPASIALAIVPEIAGASAGDLSALAEIAAFLVAPTPRPEVLRGASVALGAGTPHARRLPGTSARHQ